MTKDNVKLWAFDLTGLPPAPRGKPQIEVCRMAFVACPCACHCLHCLPAPSASPKRSNTEQHKQYACVLALVYFFTRRSLIS